MGGTYTLLVALPDPASVEVGALGRVDLPAGGYAYTGSARGSGGFARVDRHRRVARGDHDTRHWHVDYLTGHPSARLVGTVRTAGADVECAVARRLPAGPVDGFGASDCSCASHLAHDPSLAALRAAAVGVHRRVEQEESDTVGSTVSK